VLPSSSSGKMPGIGSHTRHTVPRHLFSYISYKSCRPVILLVLAVPRAAPSATQIPASALFVPATSRVLGAELEAQAPCLSRPYSGVLRERAVPCKPRVIVCFPLSWD